MISKEPVGAEFRSGLIVLVVKVVCLGCRLLVCGDGIGGDVRVFFVMGALFRVYMSIVVFPLSVVCIVSSVTHAGFHVTWNGKDRMGVSSSLGWSRVSCSGVSPLLMCLQSCFAVRWSLCHWFTW